MSRLDDLIKELCPNGVEYKIFKEFMTSMPKGTLKQNELVVNGKYPVINSGRDYYGFYDNYNNDADVITIASRGEYAGFIHYSNEKFWAGGLCYPFKSKDSSIITKYIYYYLKNIEKYIRDNIVAEGSIPALNKADVEKIEIPIPPLPIQEEIVRILDNFTELTAELTAELQDRKKQFHHYLDEMFKNQKCVKLGSFSTVVRGGSFQKKDFVSEGYPCIHYGQMYTHFGIVTDNVISYLSKETFDNSKKASKGDIVMAVTSENVEDVCSCTAWIGESDIAISGHTAIIKHNQEPRYLSYYFHSEHFFTQKVKLAHGTKVIEVTPSTLENIDVPLPSIDEQKRIADILDKFDKYCNDLSEGLPAEIQYRQQQYEYYRDKLLTFKRAN